AIVIEQISTPGRHADVGRGLHGESPRVRIELRAGVVEIQMIVVRISAVEYRALELHRSRVYATGNHANALVRRVLPMVAEWSEWILGGRRAVHVRDRPERRFADRRGIEPRRQTR